MDEAHEPQMIRYALQSCLGVNAMMMRPGVLPLENGDQPPDGAVLHSIDLIASDGVQQRLMFLPTELDRLLSNCIRSMAAMNDPVCLELKRFADDRFGMPPG